MKYQTYNPSYSSTSSYMYSGSKTLVSAALLSHGHLFRAGQPRFRAGATLDAEGVEFPIPLPPARLESLLYIPLFQVPWTFGLFGATQSGLFQPNELKEKVDNRMVMYNLKKKSIKSVNAIFHALKKVMECWTIAECFTKVMTFDPHCNVGYARTRPRVLYLLVSVKLPHC